MIVRVNLLACIFACFGESRVCVSKH
uniref:Uncharacterized protein n=1 Tax=Rhizophora mucronata TaxID=61149 RepID=A0A2P2NFW1_RHIMU